MTILDAVRSGDRRTALEALRDKLADFVVLDRDLLECAPDEIQQTRVLATYVGGRCVFER